MPRDFLAAVIGGCRQRIAGSFAEVKVLKGARKALKLAEEGISLALERDHRRLVFRFPGSPVAKTAIGTRMVDMAQAERRGGR